MSLEVRRKRRNKGIYSNAQWVCDSWGEKNNANSRPCQDSNLESPDSKSGALSIGPQGLPERSSIESLLRTNWEFMTNRSDINAGMWNVRISLSFQVNPSNENFPYCKAGPGKDIMGLLFAQVIAVYQQLFSCSQSHWRLGAGLRGKQGKLTFSQWVVWPSSITMTIATGSLVKWTDNPVKICPEATDHLYDTGSLSSIFE